MYITYKISKNLPKSKRPGLFLNFRKTRLGEKMGTHHEGPILSMFILIMLANGFVETYGKTGNQVEIKIKMSFG